MDISSCSDKSDYCQDVSSFGGLQSSFKDNHCFDSHLVNQLEISLARTLRVNEVEQVQPDFSNVKDRDDECQIIHQQLHKGECSPKFLNKYEDPSRNAYTRSTSSMPTPLNLVSAMKGSREKNGASPKKKLSVSWAPDVYDPIPTSLSHTLTGSKKQHKSKNNKKNWKNGKKGQKGKSSSRGATAKDKKQLSKNSSAYNKSMDTRERLAGPNDEFADLTNVGSPDSQSYCGTSFLKNSLTKMHYPVAEAL